MKLILAVAAAALVAVGLSACEKKDDTSAPKGQHVELVLDYFPNADHAGIYGAIASGAFRKGGLDVTPRTPPDPSAPLKLLTAGRADIAISYEPELLLARDKGADLVAIGAIVQKPLTSIISLPAAKIAGPANLRGKKVGTAGIPYQSAYLRTILAGAKVPANTVSEINVGFNLVPALLTKKVDAVLGAFWNYEGVQLQLAKRNPRIIRMEKVGVPTYNELIFVARRSDLKSQGQKFRRFMQAVADGYRGLRTNANPAIDALIKANPDLDRKLQVASVQATLPVFFPAGKDLPFGFQDPRQWRTYGKWMLDNKLVSKLPDTNRAQTNAFLPGEGLP